ncbi:MAG TPA: CoA transferase [Syntrophomonadaceae bacterium]|nr:CoA transferase [Syntrophomonadaceae bacterium]
MMKKQKSKFGIMAGIKVLNCATVVAAPFAAALFSDHGADVIHIENTNAPDLFREFGKGYSMEHRNQRNLTLDMASEEGQKIFEKLLVDCDIFIESSKPGSWTKFGFDDESLWKIKPDLVIVHVSGYGQEGDPKYVTKPAFDMIGQAFSGFLSLNGMEEPAPPLLAKLYTCDYFAGFTAAWSSLAALLHARQTGQGESIDVAMFEANARVQAGYSLEGLTDGVQPTRIGNKEGKVASDIVFKTKDNNWIVIAVAVPNKAYLELLGLGDDPDFKSIGFVARGEARASKYEQAARDLAAAYTLDELLSILENIDVACSPVMTYEMMLNNSHYQARNTIAEWYDPVTDTNVKGIGVVPKFKNAPGQIFRGSPTYGMDNEEVLEELGYSANEIQNLYTKKVIIKK